ncbi:hypothetical protein K440DRAFT_631000 [Wilcoxina mikolae CBS 423.85]|nr:hypothetical protein K440DRAFT_631000 [Wilcoxina mikolae CBS 423.85]
MTELSVSMGEAVPRRFPSSSVEMTDASEPSPTPEQAFGIQQIEREEYIDAIQGMVPDQQIAALAGAVFDIDVKVTAISGDMKKMERRINKRIHAVEKKMDGLEVTLGEIKGAIEKMTREFQMMCRWRVEEISETRRWTS